MRGMNVIFIVLLLAAAGPASAGQAGASVVLKAEAVAGGEHVLLAEIAEISGGEADLQEKLRKIVVGRSPNPGQKRNYMQQDVLLAMQRAGIAEGIDVRGISVNVTASSEALPAAMLADAAAKAVREYFLKDADLVVETEIANAPSDVLLRNAQVSLDVETPPSGFRPGTQAVRVRVLQDGKRVAEASVSLKVRITGSVYVAARRITGNEILDEEDIKEIRRELSPGEMQNRFQGQKLAGMRSRRPVAKDEILQRSGFSVPQVIKRGDLVTIHVRRGGLELATRGEAKSDGLLDEVVRVTLVDGGEEVRARASAVGEVTIDDPNRGRRFNLER